MFVSYSNLTPKQEMTSAKITRCNHYFHGVCLRKWLYVQDRCPLCHEIIMCQEQQPQPSSADDARIPDEHEPIEDGVEVVEGNLNIPLL